MVLHGLSGEFEDRLHIVRRGNAATYIAEVRIYARIRCAKEYIRPGAAHNLHPQVGEIGIPLLPIERRILQLDGRTALIL